MLPVKVERVDLRDAYAEINRTALSSDRLSEATRTVLRRAALLDTFDSQPDACHCRAAGAGHRHRHALARALCTVGDEL